MSNSRIPSPARSLGNKSTPRRYKQRRTRSIGSPAQSENSVKLTAIIPDFVVSPLPKRRSVLTDDTYIDMPKRQSWWKKLDENSRDVMELLEHKEVPEGNNMIEENFDVEILSQEKKNYTLDLPESSDGESINSIVIPQRKLFTHKENHPPKKFPHIINNREELAQLQKSHVDHVSEINVRPKSLFNQPKKQKTKPIFPSALINISANKSIANKTKEIPLVETKGQVRNLFGNRPGMKRKNMFADFIVSESDDEIPEIQPKVFGFNRKHEEKHRISNVSRGLQHSPTSSIIDIDMDDWKHLPSSTMVENQIEELVATPIKRSKLSKVAETNNMDTLNANKTINKTKLQNESIKSKNRSMRYSNTKIDEHDREMSTTNIQETDQIEELAATSSKRTRSINVAETSNIDIMSVNKTKPLNESIKSKNSPKINKNERGLNATNKQGINQIEELTVTPSRLTRSSKIAETNNTDIVDLNKTTNKTKLLNESIKSKNSSMQISNPKDNEHEREMTTTNKQGADQIEELTETNNLNVNKTANKTKLFNESIKSKNRSMQFLSPKTIEQQKEINTSNKQEIGQINSITLLQQNDDKILNDANSSKQCNKFTKVQKAADVLTEVIDKENKDDENTNIQDKQPVTVQNPSESDAEDDFTLEYENDDENFENRNHIDTLRDENNKKMESTNQNQFTNKIGTTINKEDEQIQTHNQAHPDYNNSNQKKSFYNNNKENIHNEEFGNKIAEEMDSNNIVVRSQGEEDDRYVQMENESDVCDIQSTNEELDEGDESDIDNDKDESQSTEHINDSDTIENEKSSEESEEPNEENNIDNDSENLQNKELGENNESDEVNENQNDNELNHEEIQHTNKEKADKELDIEYELDIADNNEHSNCHKNYNNQENKNNASAKITHSFVSNPENKKNNETKIDPPEAILYEKTNNLIESFTIEEHKSPRKTKSIVRQHSLRPSLAPVRESTGFSDNTANSSANSGWDSHRTTRKTLRKTFGKDFTPRKSLRTLVMEKSAKRQTFNPDLGDITKHPHANSTELPGHDEKFSKRQTFNPDLQDISRHPRANSTELPVCHEKSIKRQTFNPNLGDISKHPHANSTELLVHDEKFAKRQTINPDLLDISRRPPANSTELPMLHENSVRRQTFNPDLQDISKHPHANSTELPAHDKNESTEHSEDSIEKDHEKMEESKNYVNKSPKLSNNHERNNEETEENDNYANESPEYSEEETVEKTSEEMEESGNYASESPECSEEDISEKDHEEMEASDNYANESPEQSKEYIVEKDHEDIEESDNYDDESPENSEEEITENHHMEVEESVEENNSFVNESPESSDDNTIENRHTEIEETVEESEHELSKRMRQTKLEMFLQKIEKEENKIREDVMNSLKVTKDTNPFKLPYIPIRRTVKSTQKKIKPKAVKTTTLYVLPEEIVEDMKYKPPKRFQPASWTTNRLYKYLETKLEPKYDYMARVRAEKLVTTLYNFTKLIRRHEVAPSHAVDALKHEMARLNIVHTHYQFYNFFHEFMPREIRVKVNPDVVNKIQMPKDVFANIIR